MQKHNSLYTLSNEPLTPLFLIKALNNLGSRLTKYFNESIEDKIETKLDALLHSLTVTATNNTTQYTYQQCISFTIAPHCQFQFTSEHTKRNSSFFDSNASFSFKPNEHSLIPNGIQCVYRSPQIHQNNITSILKLSDTRIATAGSDNAIAISSYNLHKHQWNVDVYEKHCHDKQITSLCEISDQRLISSSKDIYIKIWKVCQNKLSLLQILDDHSYSVNKVIALHHNKFASSSGDRTIKIWSSDTKIEIKKTFKLNTQVFVMLLLQKRKNVLVASTVGSLLRENDNKELLRYSPQIVFYNVKKYVRLNTIQTKQSFVKERNKTNSKLFYDSNELSDNTSLEYYTTHSNHIVELYNGNIALSSETIGFPIVIIDTENYTEITKINYNECGIVFKYSCALCVLNNYSLICLYKSTFINISIQDNEIVYCDNNENSLQKFKHQPFITTNHGKYLLIGNDSGNVSIYQLVFN